MIEINRPKSVVRIPETLYSLKAKISYSRTRRFLVLTDARVKPSHNPCAEFDIEPPHSKLTIVSPWECAAFMDEWSFESHVQRP